MAFINMNCELDIFFLNIQQVKLISFWRSLEKKDIGLSEFLDLKEPLEPSRNPDDGTW